MNNFTEGYNFSEYRDIDFVCTLIHKMTVATELKKESKKSVLVHNGIIWVCASVCEYLVKLQYTIKINTCTQKHALVGLVFDPSVEIWKSCVSISGLL